MAINWRTDYAMRMLYEVAKLGEGARATVREAAEAADVPYDYARTIARDLAARGLLRSKRGVGGGIELARPADEISMLDIFRAMDEPASLALCTQEARCPREKGCPIHVGLWVELDGVIETYLKQTTLAQAVDLESSAGRRP